MGAHPDAVGEAMTDDETQELVAAIASAMVAPFGSVLLVKLPTPDRLRSIIGALSLLRLRTGCEFLVTTREFTVEQLGVSAAPMEVAAGIQRLLRRGADADEIARVFCADYMVMSREPRYVLEGDAKVC